MAAPVRPAPLDSADADAYLRRLGLDAEAPSADALVRLHRAQVERVPYETVWIFLGEGWGIDPAETGHRMARTSRGGYCFQLNGAFAALLTSLGYDVTIHVGGVHGADGPDGSELTNHAALIVDGCPAEASPDGRWYADVGLGDALHEPLPLHPGTYRQGPTTFSLDTVTDGIGDWHFGHDPNGSFAGVSIVEHPVGIAAFARRHEYFATAPDSPFAEVVTAQCRVATGVVVLRGCVLTKPGGDPLILDRLDDWLGALDAELGMQLDVPSAAVHALWSRVVRTHEKWAAAQTPE